MHATTTAANLTHLIRWTTTWNRTTHTIHLATTTDNRLTASNYQAGHRTHTPATIHLPGTTTIPTTDALPLLTWLERLHPDTNVRIGTATLADGTGTLLTLRTGPQAIRLHTPAAPR